MLRDTWTISKKDIREVLFSRGNKRGGLISILVVVGLIGVYFPLFSQDTWFNSPIAVLNWSWMPIFMVTSLVTDSIAGERERHTLETLLASRVKDQAILLGKISAAVLYGWGLFMVSLLVGAVTINVVNWGDPLQFYPLDFFIACAGLSLLLCVFISAIGVFVSLRAPTARIAYQRLSLSMLAVIMLPVILTQILPQGSLAPMLASLEKIDLYYAFWVLGIALLGLDVLFILAALARFKRTRLILE
jgi:ABC-2 type transport system permease protein